ncbi:MAG: VCBS repeat-containing protein, partial [Planctomycetota bacterium]
MGERPSRVEVADLNDDGSPDVVVLNEDSEEVTVLLGDGFGNITTTNTTQVLREPKDIAVGDLNGDRFADVVVAGSFGSTIAVLFSNPFGGFSSTAVYHVDWPVHEVEIADVDADGHLDVVVGMYSISRGRIGVLLNNGLGQFPAPPTYFITDRPSNLLVLDFTGDGHPDAVFLGGNALQLLRGDGLGGFSTPILSDLPPTWSAKDLAAGDVDGDGILDVVVARQIYYPLVLTMVGDGTGHFTAAEGTGPALDMRLDDIALGDLDGDGVLDAVVTGGISGRKAVRLRGSGNGLFGAPELVACSQPLDMAIADMNGDRRPDIVSSGGVVGDVGLVTVVLADGMGGIGATPSTDDPRSVAMFDVDGDGDEDFVLYTIGSGRLDVRLNDGLGNLSDGPSTPLLSPYDYVGFIESGDVNGDGVTDVVLAGELGISATQEVAVFLGDGAGGYVFASANPIPLYVYAEIEATDLDLDGDLDLTVLLRDSNEFRIYEGNGLGGFSLISSHLTTASPSPGFTVADIDGNGLPDVLVGTMVQPGAPASGNIELFLATGPLQYGLPVLYSAGVYPSGVVSADFDRDGNLDVACTNGGGYGGEVLVFLGNGAGGLGAPTSYETSVFPFTIAVADIGGDGILDLAVGQPSLGNVSLLEGDGGG